MHDRMRTCIVIALAAFLSGGARSQDGVLRFTRLVPLPAPKVAGHAEEYPGGMFNAENLVDGDARTEHSSNGKGTESFVEFDFGTLVPLAALTHHDRAAPATVAASERHLCGAEGAEVARWTIAHAAARSGLTTFILPARAPVRRARWRVTALGPHGYGTVGGAEMRFFAAGAASGE